MFKIGIVGAGYIGKLHANVYSQMKDVSVVAVCDSNIESAEKLALSFSAKACCGLYEMMNYEIDILDVCLPTHFHRQAVEMAIMNGISVLCEKPMALSLEDATAMEQLAARRGIPLMVGQCLRFDRNYGILKYCIDSGLYGSLRMLKLFRNTPIPSWSNNAWLLNKELSGGIITDLHIHDTDFISWALGEPTWVFTNGNDYQVISTYGFSKTIAWAEASWRQIGGFTFEAGYDAEFEDAVLRFDGLNIMIIDRIGKVDSPNPYTFELDYEIYRSDNSYENEIAYFLQCLTRGIPFRLCTASSSVMSLQIVLSERTSMETNEKVFVKKNI